MLKTLILRTFAIDLSQASLWQRISLYISLVVFVTSFAVSLTDLAHYEGGDFNLRYIQARCGFLKLDPYVTTASWWWNGIAQDVHDNYFKNVPRPWGVACQTPALLLFYMPLSLLSWETARWACGILEWGAFLASVLLLSRVIAQQSDRLLAVATALFFMAGSPFWRLHVERGQYYIFTVLFIAALLFFLTYKKNDFLSGLILGVTISIRPTTLFLAVPFVLHRRWKIVSGTFCSGLAIGLISLCVFGLDAWKSFHWISKKYELASIDFTKNPFEDCMKTSQVPELQNYEVSGKEGGAPFPSVNSTMAGLIRITKPLMAKHEIPADTLLLAAKLFWVGSGLGLLIFFSRRRSRFFHTHPSADTYLCYVGITAVNIVEYAIPYRAAYADIYYLLPVMLGIPVITRQKSAWLGVLLLTALASQQNLLGLVNGWYSIPVRVVGLTLFSVGVLYCWRCQDEMIPANNETCTAT